MVNPLQELNSKNFETDQDRNKSLESVANAEGKCGKVYQQLTRKTKCLADETYKAQFDWRVRVGGMRGFQELLLPVFHPVYGVPYIPSSSLKGAILAQAKKHANNGEINLDEVKRILGDIEGGIGTVQVLDAFPTEPCLSVDMANPQWSWKENHVQYNPVPHPLLSMEEPEILIGLVSTSRGRYQEQKNQDLQTVKGWLKQALNAGIGSRVSAGYGRTQVKANLPYSSTHHFQFYSQGMFGASNQDKEFRPVALRGILRYWFRAIALGLYNNATAQQFENQLFGQLSQEGSVRLGVELTEEDIGKRNDPYFCQGNILIEAKTEEHHNVIKQTLLLASHLGGIGRGSRRPLHWNHPRLRGCLWEFPNFILPGDEVEWSAFIEDTLDSFREVYPEGKPDQHPLIVSVQEKGKTVQRRCQDILNNDTAIYIFPSPELKYPEAVNNWNSEGNQRRVIGEGLRLLYSDNRFKGETKNKQTNYKEGNRNVGGKLGIPSYVWIQSNFPDNDEPYQVISVFGAEHPQRKQFIRALPDDAICVYP
ncbi:MAG: RAMP superfamily CRISPR-associated protein [Halothece sp.]